MSTYIVTVLRTSGELEKVIVEVEGNIDTKDLQDQLVSELDDQVEIITMETTDVRSASVH